MISDAESRGGEERIGGALQAINTELLYCGTRLRSLLYGRMAVAANEPLSRLVGEMQRQVCAVAIIGQLKAGKSSFINGFTRRPGLLPVNVNPWTAVVTRLHFGRPNGPEKGASFQFFAEAEWRSLADGSEKLRRLVERLIPGFRYELLRRQFETMRELTELRLGKQFRHLLGKTHEFETITADILDRYISVGTPAVGEIRGPVAGRFSDVTKSADLYFPLSPFAYPVTIVDTPGTNDPFLIRDEITCRNLEYADVYVVVLTAQQALTTADLALLRILQGLNKDRIVVFVNRIDQLNDPVTETRQVTGHVKRILEREFPNTPIPVVAGSAHWGQAAASLVGADSGFEDASSEGYDIAALMSPAFTNYARAAGVVTDEDIAAWRTGAEPPDLERLAAALWAVSGMTETGRLVSGLMLKGPGANYVKLVAACMTAVAETLLSTARDELAILSAPAIPPEPDPEPNPSGGPEDREEARRNADRMNTLIGEIERICHVAKADFQQARDESLENLRSRLEREVFKFADEEARALQTVLRDHTPAGKNWRCDTTPLRSILENEFMLVWAESRDRLLAVQEQVTVRLRAVLHEVTSPEELNSQPPLPVSDPSPSIQALGRAVAVDLDARLWGIWWRRKRSPEEKSRELFELIRADFVEVADLLVASASKDMTQHIAETVSRFLNLSLTAAKVVRERRRRLENAFDLARAERRRPSDPVQLLEEAERLARCRDAIAGSGDVLRRLRALGEHQIVPTVSPPAPTRTPERLRLQG